MRNLSKTTLKLHTEHWEKPMSSPSLDPELITKAQLNHQRIEIHQLRIGQALNNEVQTSIPVTGACTINNGGIVSWKAVVRFVTSQVSVQNRKFYQSAFLHWKENHLVTCIPAAGAASRFLGEIQKFVIEVESRIPSFGKIATAFLNRNADFTLTLQETSEIRMLLQELNISDDILSLPEAIQQQEFLTLKDTFESYYAVVYHLLDKKVMPENFGKNSTLTPENGSFKDHILERSMHIHWETKKEIRGSFSVADQRAELSETKESSRSSLSSTLAPGQKLIMRAYCAAKSMILHYANLPKALVPTTIEGDNFLKLKLTEQVSLFPCAGNVLIAPALKQTEFEKEVEKVGLSLQKSYSNVFDLTSSPFAPPWLAQHHTKRGEWKVFEQGRDLSTIRFQTDGTPFIDTANEYSPVSAGHGELVHVFDKIAQTYPNADCLHIRNIDNIIGASSDRASELNMPAHYFQIVRDCLEFLRGEIQEFLKGPAPKNARIPSQQIKNVLQVLASTLSLTVQADGFADFNSSNGQFLGISAEATYKLLGSLFHWPTLDESLNGMALWEHIHKIISRPLSVFGVVRKEVGDVGGGPVFARMKDGTQIKLCMEMTHANAADAKDYFGTRGKVTHFNPVLVFFEMRTHCKAYSNTPEAGKPVAFSQLFDDRFWLMTKREFQGKPVCYHETVLYELIGNSATTNLIFVEVPRTLFNPHKTIFESLAQDRKSYGFEEVLKSSERPVQF